MKLLLTSAGITNTSIRDALLELLGRPIAECRALLISTASYPLRGGPELAWNVIAGEEPRTPMAELGWGPSASSSSPRCPASIERPGWPRSTTPTPCW